MCVRVTRPGATTRHVEPRFVAFRPLRESRTGRCGASSRFRGVCAALGRDEDDRGKDRTEKGGSELGNKADNEAYDEADPASSAPTSASAPSVVLSQGKTWLDPEKLGMVAVVGNSVIELVRLGVLLPLRYMVVVPVLWLGLRLKDALKPPSVVLRELTEMSARGEQIDVGKLVDVLKAANGKGQSAVVVEFFERECLGGGLSAEVAASDRDGTDDEVAGTSGSPSGSPSASQSDSPMPSLGGRVPVNADVVKEYLIALVKTGRIDAYGDDTLIALSGQSYASLSVLLRDLVEAADGRGPRKDRRPGETASWPLHIAVNGAVVAGRGQATALQSLFWFFSTLAVISLMWMIGAVTARRVVARAGQGQGIGQEPHPGMASSLEPKEFAKENMPQKSIKTFADVKGCDEAIGELKEIVEYLKKPEKFVKLGGKLPKGVLLTGPPGTGKTLLARAVAGEVRCLVDLVDLVVLVVLVVSDSRGSLPGAPRSSSFPQLSLIPLIPFSHARPRARPPRQANVPFFYKSGSEFDEMFVGVGSRRVRSLFAAAKKKSPCIVFIDEIDAVGGTRSNYEASGGSRKTLNQLLTEMDGFEENSGVVVIGATNLADMLDPALTRPGRFDRHVAVALPDVKGRKSVLELYLSNKPVDSNVDSELLARRTPGFSGADLFNMVNEAALMAATKDLDRITEDCLDEARDKILMGSPRALSQSQEARRLTAYHEGGHALVALYTPGAKPIHKATIIPRGHALGMVSQVPDKDEYSTTKQQMMAHIDVCMGGKVAEEMIFGPEFVTSGATSDLKSATRMVCRRLRHRFVYSDSVIRLASCISRALRLSHQPHTLPYLTLALRAGASHGRGLRHERSNRSRGTCRAGKERRGPE